ncbi:Fis family transcriptional regulator [Psychromonas sp. PRT-SC03]|nr:Fis family transcriptional regulator [Psychromonas sp. PRT-SC03]
MKKKDRDILLIVEDDIGLLTQLKWHFSTYHVITATRREDAINAIRLHEPSVMIQDLGIPPDADGVNEGFELLRQALHLSPYMKVIVMTGNDNAIKAVNLGAYDFYSKPVESQTLDLIVKRALHMYKIETKNREYQLLKPSHLEGLISADEHMLNVCKQIRKIAPTNAACLLLGESGTGKEVLAKALHNLSLRSKYPFIAINCAALPENLFESELFGYEKGAFTGAMKSTLGKFELANNGTIFLDEIGEMPLLLQAKLLRFLQEKVIERLGGRELIQLDTRIICATNRNLDEMMQEGTFREDLYSRIAEIQIDIPALRKRSADKVLLAHYLLKKYIQEENLKSVSFSDDAIQSIEEHPWPGNIRELNNKIIRAIIMHEGKYIQAHDLGLTSVTKAVINLKAVRQQAETLAIQSALLKNEYNVSASAKALGVTRPTLYDLMKKYHINTNETLNTIMQKEVEIK